MARPETIRDVKEEDRYFDLGELRVDRMSTNPNLLKHYAGLIDAIEKQGGTVTATEWNASKVELKLARTPAELKRQLEVDQQSWDVMERRWNQAMNRDAIDTEIKEYEKSGISEWAKREGRTDPYDPLAAHQPVDDLELDEIRDELGVGA